MKNACFILVGATLLSLTSCSPKPKASNDVTPKPAEPVKTKAVDAPKPVSASPKSDISGMTLAETMAFATKKAKAKQYDYIIDNLLSEECKTDMARKHGADKWKDKCRENLKTLPFYFGWMKKHSTRVFGDRIVVTGQHGCHAEYLKVGDSYMIVNFGQHISSM